MAARGCSRLLAAARGCSQSGAGKHGQSTKSLGLMNISLKLRSVLRGHACGKIYLLVAGRNALPGLMYALV
jgi:hypothetical protein